MASTTINLLIVEDSEDDTLLILRELKRSGLTIDSARVDTEMALVQALDSRAWDLVISDFNLPHMTGFRALELVRKYKNDVPFILVSGSVGEKLAVEAMKAGAQDYIMKDNLARLAVAAKREILEAGERSRRREIEATLQEKEKQLLSAQRMEAIGRLAGGIAHDLNNMIGACTLYAEIALDPDQDLASVRESVQEIVKAQERATRLVKQLLAFSRKQVVAPQIITINQVILHIQKMLSQILGEDVELHLDLARDLKSIRADPTQIDQVIMNLVVNARDAMPKGGKLTIKTSNEIAEKGHWLLKDPTALPKAFVRLTVTDTGTGMDEKVLSRIFEPFFTTKEVGKGTGLGLATVFGIVKQANGEIRVRSELGKGTSFDLHFEATDEAPLDAQSPSPSLSEIRRTVSKTLLLVEDDAGIRKALEKALSHLGYKVHLASNGEEGLKVFEIHREEIDLLVSDVVMPKLSGPEMAKRMWASKPKLKVLFLSGYSPEALEPHLADHEGTFLLPKPFTSKQFSQKVAEILGDRP